MATHKITATNSASTNANNGIAFGTAPGDDTPGPDTLTVDSGAYLIATGSNGIGAELAATGAWTVTVSGVVLSTQGAGILLLGGIAGASSTITVSADGEVGGNGTIGIEV